MTRVNVKDLKSGMKLFSRYVIKNKKLSPYKGKPGHFLTLTLGDSTGQVEAKIWEKAEEAFHSLSTGDLLEVRGDAREYNGSMQVNISSFSVCPESEFDPRDYLPSSPRDIDEMMAELKGIIELVGNPYLKDLLLSFFNDGEWLKGFSRAPAAKLNHQAYLGGLLEHTLNLARASRAVAKLYPRLDRDLLLTGAILHDIGKIEEYQCDRHIDFSDGGRLLGHIVIGVGEVDRRIREVTAEKGFFPENLRLKVLHIITSHHGLYEWQSPKKPKFMEAVVVHILDMLDTMVDSFSRAVDESADDNSSWSAWSRSLERFVFLK